MKILKPSDVITLISNDIEVDFKPLKYDQAIEVNDTIKFKSGDPVLDVARQTGLLIKYAVKEVRGIKDYSDNDIKIQSKDGNLSDDDISMVINVLSATPLLAPIGYISTSSKLQEYDDVKLLINGKEISIPK